MATRIGLSQPYAFLSEPGEPAVPWNQWENAFKNYLLAIGTDSFNAARKRALLLHCIGLEGQRIFNTLPESTDEDNVYDNALAALKRHFQPSVNVVSERYKFRQRKQHHGESIDFYVASLRDLAKTCSFETCTDKEMIRDQIVEKTTMPKIRERLLMESELTLEKTLEIARSIESAVRESKILGNAQTSHVNRVHAPSKPQQRERACYRCGSKSHLANDSRCKAIKHRCPKCTKIGHFEKLCHSAPVQRSYSGSSYGGGSSASFRPGHRVHHVDTVCDEQGHMSGGDSTDDGGGVQVLATSRPRDNVKPVYCTVRVNHVPLRMMVDTGSAVTLISQMTYNRHFVDEALEDVSEDDRLSSYTDHSIDVLGCLKSSVMYKNNVCITKIYVAKKGINILGRDLVEMLQLNVYGKTMTCNSVTDNVKSDTNIHVPVKSVSNTVELPEILQPYSHMFKSGDNEELNCAKGFVHRVKVNDKITPVQQKLRRLPFSVRDKVSNELKRLENLGVIEKIDASEWVSPIVVSWKKSGDVRLCVDLRQVNRAVIPDKYPLPNIEEMFSELRNAKYFSQLDLASAYHQLLLHPDSRHLTAFITHDGLYQYKRVCFGISSAPSAFQKMLSSILSGIQGVQNYLDDVILCAKTKSEHDAILLKVIQRLDKYGIKLNEKCQFAKQSLKFLGHTITSDGIQIDDDKFKSITNMSVPTDEKSLRSFLGLAGYFARHIPSFAQVVEPLRCMLRREGKFEWSNAAQTSFDQVRQLVGRNLTLSMYDPDLDVIVTTDASAYGLGAVLTQIKNGCEITVACVSRTMSKAERNYSVGEKEALACVWACEKWHTYLWGRKFNLCTDHQALVTLLSKGSDRASMRIARWSCRLLQYNYEMVFKKSEENTVADALSRLPIDANENEFDHDDEVICHVALENMGSIITISQFKTESNNDDVFNELKSHIHNGWQNYKSMSDQMQSYKNVKDELYVCDDIIMRGDRIVVPCTLTNNLLHAAHESHQGMTRTKQRLRELYWWPHMDKQVDDLVKQCTTCKSNDKSVKSGFAPLTPVKYPDKAWSKLSMDIVGPFERGPNECRFAITLIDYHSKWPEICFTSTVTSSKCIEFLKQVFSREGFPDEIITDHGVQFMSNEFESFLSERGIRHGHSSIYYPQSNGAIERFNSVLKNNLQDVIDAGKYWKSHVIEFLAVYRTTPHATTGMSPSALLHNRYMRTKLNIIGYKLPDVNVDVNRVKEKVQLQQSKYKFHADQKRNVTNVECNVGDWVRVRKPGFVPKGHRRYSEPIQIMKKLSSCTYVLNDGRTWNISKLVKCAQPDECYISENEEVENVNVESPELRRSNRTRRPPQWLNDYVTE